MHLSRREIPIFVKDTLDETIPYIFKYKVQQFNLGEIDDLASFEYSKNSRRCDNRGN